MCSVLEMFWPCQDSQVYKTAQTGDYYYGPQAIPSVSVCCQQGHPTTIFCIISVRKQKLSRLFYYLRTAENFLLECSIHRFNFRSLSKQFPTIFWSLIFTFYSPCQANFRRKSKPKIFAFKNVMNRGIRKILSFVKRSIVSKGFGKITLKPL